MKCLVNAVIVGAVVLASAGYANAQGETPFAIDPNSGRRAYHSERLGADFLIQKIRIAGFDSFWAARIVSRPESNSPLRQLGLDVGDVITRLDGVPLTNYEELERHIVETDVRYIRSGTSRVRRGEIYISPYSTQRPEDDDEQILPP